MLETCGAAGEGVLPGDKSSLKAMTGVGASAGKVTADGGLLAISVPLSSQSAPPQVFMPPPHGLHAASTVLICMEDEGM